MSKRLSCPIGFNAQHSPMGAFMSFTCGHPGTKGGIGLQIGQPADQEVFVGVIDGDRYADAPLQSLPFYIGAVSKAAEAFTVEQAGPSEANVQARRGALHGSRTSSGATAGAPTAGAPGT